MTARLRFVLDASAMLAYLFEERGGEAVLARLPGSLVSAVNWAEVVQKSRERGADVDGLRIDMATLGMEVIPFTEDHAERTAELWEPTRSFGLSLGDRACLALAERQGATAITADRQWASLDIGVPIEVIR